ncbi:spondin-2-like [Copidosoma floridanum]|uniref:spondin-2-like n=1 Tax=Copidosoma floridanum TaxID=29053 RepID=UPI0006C9DAA8|nr:spondin-2-like [Copidosoma floridanum]
MFRVDQQHHLVSLVSMIDPSPDWFIGVSGLELCLTNCSWIENKELNLYPVDAGTDDGVTYEAEDAKTDPQDVIRRITTTWPVDARSPFYDETAIDMNPLAKLYLKRQRVYEKECDRTAVTATSGEGETERPIKRSKYFFLVTLLFSLPRISMPYTIHHILLPPHPSPPHLNSFWIHP